MARPARPSEADPGAGAPPARDPSAGTPRWVKVAGAIALLVALLLGAMLLLGGGEHGPARHTSSAQQGRTQSAESGSMAVGAQA